jgi:hypothetical protein
MGDASRSDVCPYRQTKGVFPSVYGGTTGIRTLFSRHRTEIQLRNPLRNRGKSGVNRGGRVGRLRVKLHHFDPCRPPRKGFESLRFRQSKAREIRLTGFFLASDQAVLLDLNAVQSAYHPSHLFISCLCETMCSMVDRRLALAHLVELQKIKKHDVILAYRFNWFLVRQMEYFKSK